MFINPYAFYDRSLISFLRYNNLGSNLQFCLDAGDQQSVPANNSTVWNDLSTTNQNFFKGNTASAETRDPTYNGNIGNLGIDEYWRVNTTTYFTAADAASNTSWTQGLHKDGCKFSACAWVYCGSVGSVQTLISTRDNAGAPTPASRRGSQWHISAGNTMQWTVSNGSTSVCLQSAPGPGQGHDVAANQWTFLAITIDEDIGGSGIMFRTNQNIAYQTSTYSAPSTANGPNTMRIGASAGAANAFTLNSRMGMIAAWNRKLTDDEVSSIYEMTRSRYGV